MLNGNRYDASTGKLLGNPTTPQSSGQSAGTIDGFVQSSHTKKKVTQPRRVQSNSRSTLKSKTLMRHAVSKPKNTEKAKQPKQAITKASSLTDTSREERAKNTTRSTVISKFGHEVKKITSYATLPVTKSPVELPLHQEKVLTPPTATAISPQVQVADPFTQAINNSTSHTNPKPKMLSKRQKMARKLKISPSLLNVSLGLFALLIIGGYVAYNNVPNLAMRVASARSGVAGSMPSYQPSGYAINGAIQYKPGQITVHFKSNSDQRSYSVAETRSDWNSEALLENHVAVNKKPYQTFQDKGKTIYIYNGDSASWVDKGIWYEVKGNSSLTTDQVLRIANGL